MSFFENRIFLFFNFPWFFSNQNLTFFNKEAYDSTNDMQSTETHGNEHCEKVSNDAVLRLMQNIMQKSVMNGESPF